MTLLYAADEPVSSKIHLQTRSDKSSSWWVFSLFMILRFPEGEKGTENPGSKGLSPVTFSVLFINDKWNLQWPGCSICAGLCIL